MSTYRLCTEVCDAAERIIVGFGEEGIRCG